MPDRDQSTAWSRTDPIRSLRESLSPLFEILRRLDGLRLQLEQVGGDTTTLKAITELMHSRITLTHNEVSGSCSLAERPRLDELLARVSAGQVLMDVRNSTTAFMPLYYVCRIAGAGHCEYSPIIEDLFCSPSYPMDDERFVRIGIIGRQRRRLRLSHFRDRVERLTGLHATALLDAFLCELGTWVLSATWHEAQRPAMVLAKIMDLDRFRQAVEFFHLVCTAEPATLRSSLDNQMIRFFEYVYPNLYIATYLRSLDSMKGNQLDVLQRQARTMYRNLEAAFIALLSIPVIWGFTGRQPRLWEVLYANIHRIDSRDFSLVDNRTLYNSAEDLDRFSATLTMTFLSEQCGQRDLVTVQ